MNTISQKTIFGNSLLFDILYFIWYNYNYLRGKIMFESLKRIKAELISQSEELAKVQQYESDLKSYLRIIAKNETRVDKVYYKEMIFLNDEVASITINNMKSIAMEREEVVSFRKIFNNYGVCVYGITIDKRNNKMFNLNY